MSDPATGLVKEQVYWQLKRAVRDEVTKVHHASAQLATVVPEFMRESGLDVGLRNAVFLHVRNRDCLPDAVGATDEPHPIIRARQGKWWAKMCGRLASLSGEMKVPLSQRRPPLPAKVSTRSWLEQLTFESSSRRLFLFDWNDVLMEVSSMENPNYASDPDAAVVAAGAEVPRSINLQFSTPGLSELRQQFGTLALRFPQLGVDDDAVVTSGALFADYWHDIGSQCLCAGLAVLAVDYLQRGAPMGHRAALYSLALCPLLSDTTLLLYHDSLQSVRQYDLLVDRLLTFDAADVCGNDDNFFVFEDVIREVLMVFVRDTGVPALLPCPRAPVPAARLATPPDNAVVADSGADGSADKYAAYPPNGQLPVRGLAWLVAPLSFLFADPARVYVVFREMYARYFVHLHTVSSHPQSILRLALLFERTMHSHFPQLTLHLDKLGVKPLQLAMPWLSQAFAGIFPVDQVLLLWDRVIGFDSLLILPLTAAALFGFRRTVLLKAETAREVDHIMADNFAVCPLPLLQFCLFA